MSEDFLSRMIAADGKPVERQVTYKGETAAIHFRKINAGERIKLTGGVKLVGQVGGAAQTYEVDTGEHDRTKAMLVQFCTCKADGTPYFKSLDQVHRISADLLDELHKHASEVNKAEAPGKD